MPPLAESTCSDSEAGAATLCEDPRLTEALVRVTQQLAGEWERTPGHGQVHWYQCILRLVRAIVPLVGEPVSRAGVSHCGGVR
jgi:hypothetical protein